MVRNPGLLDRHYCRYAGKQAERMAWCLSESGVPVLPYRRTFNSVGLPHGMETL
ncbi:hypothetical protein GCM10011583_72510 [Streptomyces camponoticapitis]|uniref:Uncharacterized protein n=1 Tax=Streptomyces camponoticapitis TaxID=1616125 RepID=A0ABQ2EXQ7_9ACTN|nr:hypothetical protein GCM10011583_72510 [Streptomyces camponoticapitis]